MVSFESILKNREQYPDDLCAYLEPTNFVIVRHGDLCKLSENEESDESFLDRLERSKKEGRNLFFVEWTREPKKDVVY